jgi:hypothetical protein
MVGVLRRRDGIEAAVRSIVTLCRQTTSDIFGHPGRSDDQLYHVEIAAQIACFRRPIAQIERSIERLTLLD